MAAEAAPVEHQMGARAEEAGVEVMAAEAVSDMAAVAVGEEAMEAEDSAGEEPGVAEWGTAEEALEGEALGAVEREAVDMVVAVLEAEGKAMAEAEEGTAEGEEPEARLMGGMAAEGAHEEVEAKAGEAAEAGE